MMDRGRRCRWSGPHNNLDRWGITNPTKPMVPDTATAAPVNIEPAVKIMSFLFCTLTPKCCARSSPNDMAFSSLALKISSPDPMIKNGKMIFMYSQPLIDTLPSSQPIIWRSSSPVNAIISEIMAPKKELKMIPVKIIVSTRIERSILLAKVRTRKMVKNENRILNNGKVKEPTNGIDSWKNSVKTAPTDAPEDTPNV